MTVIIGLIASESVIFASDGFALYQEHDKSPTYKFDTHNKVRILGNGRFLMGSAGSHILEIEMGRKADGLLSSTLSEHEFLKCFAEQVKHLNENGDGRQTSFILGYLFDNKAKMFLFQKDGKWAEQNGVVAMGSGADEAIHYLKARYDCLWTTREAVVQIVDAIYHTSKIPTVNFLPMVCILHEKGAVDLSTKTISMFEDFKRHLRTSLENSSFFDQEII